MELEEKQQKTEVAPDSLTEPTSSQPEEMFAQTDPGVLLQGMLARLNTRIKPRGEVIMPSVPALLDHYMESLATLFETLGKTFSAQDLEKLSEILAEQLEEGFRASPHSNVVVRYQPEKSPSTGIVYHIAPAVSTVTDEYKYWVETREPPLFGKYPDAKVMNIAAQLGDPASVPILDVGAGTGRNTLPLARLGHAVDVVELTPEFTEQIQAAATAEGLAVNITQGDILDPLVQMRPTYYQLAVVAEVVSHFRTLEELRLLLAKICEVLSPGGLLLLNSFLTVDDYEPDQLARQMSQVNWSSFMTKSELAAAMDQLPIEMLSDESQLEYERNHLPAEAWPPTGWFINWASGRDLFGFDNVKPPMELRWLVFKRL